MVKLDPTRLPSQFSRVRLMFDTGAATRSCDRSFFRQYHLFSRGDVLSVVGVGDDQVQTGGWRTIPAVQSQVMLMCYIGTCTLGL